MKRCTVSSSCPLNRVLNPREREIVAHHEMGHALVAMALPGVDPVHKVSIIPRGIGALGYTIQRPTEDRFLMTREELENKIAVLLGGRAAEKIIYDHVSTGAADDLVKATDIARAMVARYGMDEDLGHVSYDTDRPGFLGTGDQCSWLTAATATPLLSGWTRRCATSWMACLSAPSPFLKPIWIFSSNRRRISCNERQVAA